jgi:hypothetical protein
MSDATDVIALFARLIGDKQTAALVSGLGDLASAAKSVVGLPVPSPKGKISAVLGSENRGDDESSYSDSQDPLSSEETGDQAPTGQATGLSQLIGDESFNQAVQSLFTLQDVYSSCIPVDRMPWGFKVRRSQIEPCFDNKGVIVQVVTGDEVAKVLQPHEDSINRLLRSDMPEGSIIDYLPCSFGTGSNGNPSGIDLMEIRNALESTSWRLADGSEFQHELSTIWTASGMYLPNLLDGRFVMGTDLPGGVGGSNTMRDHTHAASTANLAHTHAVNPAAVTTSANSRSHDHPNARYTGTNTAGGNSSLKGSSNAASVTDGKHIATESVNHTHSVDIPSTTSGAMSANGTHSHTIGSGVAATSTENRPRFIGVLKLIKVYQG